MLYIDDRLTQHPKILKAGQLLGGGDGPARALALFLDGLTYTRTYLTDGVVPDQFVAGSALVKDPAAVARALTRVKLWHRIRAGFRIHDYHDWNQTATEIRQKRDKWRKKKAAQRRGPNGSFSQWSPQMSPGDLRRDSRARPSTTTTTKGGTRSRDPGCTTDSVQTAAPRRHLHAVENKPLKTPTHRHLCAIARAAHASLYRPGVTPPDFGLWAELVKRRLARQGFADPLPHAITAALEAVDHAPATRRAGGRR